MNADPAIVSALNAFVAQSPSLSGLVIFFAQYFPYLAAAALFLFFALSRTLSQKEKWVFFGEGFGAAIVARGIVELVKVFVERPRPSAADPAIAALLSEASFSFPSGHAAFFFALSTVVFLHNRGAGWWFFAASALIGLARIAAGVHYPSDILGGAVLGIAIGLAAHWVFAKRTSPPLNPPF